MLSSIVDQVGSELFFQLNYPGVFQYSLAFVLGSLVGSFLNVAAIRSTEAILEPTSKRNLWSDPSQCPHCELRLTPLDLVPVFSWLALLGKCRRCKSPISAQYPLVEATMGGIACLAVWLYGYDSQGFLWFVFSAWLVALAAADAKTMLLPNTLTYSLCIAGLLVAVFFPGTAWVSLGGAITGAVVCGGVMFMAYYAFLKFRGYEGMGIGDIKLTCACGAWLGPEVLAFVLLLASFGQLAVFLVVMVVQRNFNPRLEIPWGPALCLAFGFVPIAEKLGIRAAVGLS